MILDTNALSAFAEGEPAVEPLLIRASEAALPVIVLGEYQYGISLSRDKKRYEHWLAEYLSRFRVLDIDQHTSRHYAEIRSELKKVGQPIPANDLWIAALCRQHSLPILSRDLHFDRVVGITRLAW